MSKDDVCQFILEEDRWYGARMRYNKRMVKYGGLWKGVDGNGIERLEKGEDGMERGEQEG